MDLLVGFERVCHDSNQHVHHADDNDERSSDEECPKDQRMIWIFACIIKVVKTDLTKGHLVDESDTAKWCSVHRNCRDLFSICEDSIKLELISTNDKE